MTKRPFSSYFIAVTSLLLALLAASQAFFYGYGDPLENLLWIVFILSLVWLGYVMPSAEIQEDFLKVINPFRIARIGLGAIEVVDTRFALRVSGEFGTISAWAAPAPGRLRHRSHSREDFRALGLKPDQLVRPGDLPSTISGSLALQIDRARKGQRNLPSDVIVSVNWAGLAMAALPTISLVLHYWA
jgi:hypothetical protein